MNATPPEANTDASRGSPAFRGARDGPVIPLSRFVLAGGLLGAALLIAAEFSPLYRETSAASRVALHTVRSGSHNDYALIPIGLLAGVLAVTAGRFGNRSALLGLVALGVAAALVALLGDLPDATASGLVGSTAVGYARARNVPDAGLYLETLGAALLLVVGGAGLTLVGRVRGERGLSGT